MRIATTLGAMLALVACDTAPELDPDGLALVPPLTPCTGLEDVDGDGVCAADDCDDTNPNVLPGRPEACDDLDNDCDGEIDEDLPIITWYVDRDLDGFGTPAGPTLTADCAPVGFAPVATDCNDFDPMIHPLVTEELLAFALFFGRDVETSEFDRDETFVGDAIDQDCDGVDTCWEDLDRDGFGEALDPTPTILLDDGLICDDGPGPTASIRGDCDDDDPDRHPSATEVPGDGVDSDCDGTETCYRDRDGDGYGSDVLVLDADGDLDCDAGTPNMASRTGDCDDTSATADRVNPGVTEICNGLDDDCDGFLDEVGSPEAETWYVDADGDGYGLTTRTIQACGSPLGYALTPGDCDDDDPTAFPGNAEVCDDVDNDCNAEVDDEAIDATSWARDADGDRCPDDDVLVRACDAPDAGWVAAAGLARPFSDACRPAEDDASDDPPDGCACTQGTPTPLGVLALVAVGAVRRRTPRRRKTG